MKFSWRRAGAKRKKSVASIADLFRRFKRKGSDFRNVPVFVILLESNQERYCHVHGDVVPKLPICDIVKATNAEQDEIEEFLRHDKIDVRYEPVTLGKLACTISHMRTWKEIVARDFEHAIVLEDDVAIREGFAFFIGKLMRELPINFDLVHLYVSGDRSEWLRHAANTEKAYIAYIPVWGRSAYLLSRSGARKLLLGFHAITNNGDFQISDMAKRGELSVYCAKQSYVDNLGQLSLQYNGERFRSTICCSELSEAGA
jgi:Glycosyltransferase family 25 (LPS biosynthesis protein)